LDGGDVGGFLLRDLTVELLLDGHDQLNGVKGVGTEVIDESGRVGDGVSVDAELGNNDLLDLILNTEESHAGAGDEGRAGRGEGRGASDEKGSNNLTEHF